MDPKERLDILVGKSLEVKRLNDDAEALRASFSVGVDGEAEVLVYSGMEELAAAVGATVRHKPVPKGPYNQQDYFKYGGVLFNSYSNGGEHT